jgi:hypothetical protein
MAKARDIHRALDTVFARTPVERLNAGEARLVVLSDLHRGQRDGADDFERSEPRYLAALEYYWTNGFTLIVLGDAEELWECRPAKTLAAYPRVAAAERRCNAAGRYVRVFGNHDDRWMHADEVARWLVPQWGPLAVREALRYDVWLGAERLGDLFLVHGHQGTYASDRNSGLSRWFVRHVWRPVQQVFRIRTTTPARDECLRERHDIAMYQWAAAHRVALIAGHTHRPVWTSKTHVQQLEEELAARRAAGASSAELDALATTIRERVAKDRYCEAEHRQRALDPVPAYFNSGCCCFSDGQLTGIEIEGGRIRLVRWAGPDATPARDVRREAALREGVFMRLRL